MNHPGEIEPLARQVEAHVGVITNVEAGPYRSHGLGGGDRRREGLPVRRHAAGRSRRAQSRQPPLRPAGAACPRLRRDARSSASAGTRRREARLVACRLQDSGSDVEALIDGRRIEYRLGAAGEHWVLNSLAALAAAEALGPTWRRPRRPWRRSRPCRAAARGGGSSSAQARSSCWTRATTPTLRRCGRCWRCWRAPSRRRAAVACWRWATCASWASRPMRCMPVWPTRSRQAGPRQVFLCGPHMRALWHKLAAAQKGVHRPDSAALAAEVAGALRAGDVIAIKGSLGSKMKAVVDAVRGGKRWRNGTLKDVLQFRLSAGGRLQPVQPLPLHHVPLDRGVPDRADPELPDRRQPDPLAAQQAGPGPADPRGRPGEPRRQQEGHADHGRAADPDRPVGRDLAVGRPHQPLRLVRARHHHDVRRDRPVGRLPQGHQAQSQRRAGQGQAGAVGRDRRAWRAWFIAQGSPPACATRWRCRS